MYLVSGHFFHDEENVYLSLQNANGISCESVKDVDCNNRLQDANGNNLSDLQHVANIEVHGNRCIWFETDDNEFKGENCAFNAWSLCQKDSGRRMTLFLFLFVEKSA